MSELQPNRWISFGTRRDKVYTTRNNKSTRKRTRRAEMEPKRVGVGAPDLCREGVGNSAFGVGYDASDAALQPPYSTVT